MVYIQTFEMDDAQASRVGRPSLPQSPAKREQAGHDVSASLVTVGLSAVELKPFLSLPALYALSRMPARRSAAARCS